MLETLKCTMSVRLGRTRTAAFAGLVLAVLCTLAPAARAAAVEGVHLVPSAPLTGSWSPRTVTAYCPFGERAIGGGGSITDTIPSSRKLALTQLQPFHITGDPDGTSAGYTVTAVETAPTNLNWSLTAYAMCAKPIPGMNIYTSPPQPASSAPVRATAAVCPAGQRVIGTGARSSDSSGQVVLQVARPSHPGDIARAQAHEVPSGYPGSWTVTAYAICAPPPSGYEVVVDESGLRASEPVKEAGGSPVEGCTGGRQLLSPGAAISNIAPGNVSLNTVFPYVAVQQGYAVAVENTPTLLNWDFIVATSVCSY